jgi:hypothetical protein
VRQRKVVSKKLFSKIGRLSGELLEVRENENLMRKILMRCEGEGARGRVNVRMFEWGFRRFGRFRGKRCPFSNSNSRLELTTNP